MEYIENLTFNEIAVGESSTLKRTLTEQDITLFAVMSGDINPAHVDPEYAKSSRFRPIALTSREDDRRSWLASAALVQLVAHMYRERRADARRVA